MNLLKQKAFIIRFIYYALILILVYICIKYALPLLMPFVIGIIIAICFRQLIDLIEKKTHIKRVFVSIIILILFYGFVGLIITLIGNKVYNIIGNFFTGLPGLYQNTFLPAVSKITDNIINEYPGTSEYLVDFTTNIDQSVFNFISNASSTAAGIIGGLASQVPELLLKLVFTIVSSFFFTIDYYRITDFILLQFTGERKEMFLKLKDSGLGSIGKFIKAYAIIISITFIELSIGFLILRIPNAILLGFVVALIDILPILGTGAVLLPWSIISFILGDTRTGIGMLVLYIVIVAVRQTIEPKIVGQQIGLHPLVTLILMYVGAQLMGVLGLIILPILATILVKLNEDGTIHLYKKQSTS